MIEIPRSDNYSKNQDRFPCRGSTYPCAICGKPVPKPKAWLHVVDGGTSAACPGDIVDDAGDCGHHPIGADCLRRHPELKPFVVKAAQS